MMAGSIQPQTATNSAHDRKGITHTSATTGHDGDFHFHLKVIVAAVDVENTLIAHFDTQVMRGNLAHKNVLQGGR